MYFKFEKDFVEGNIRCIPMIVRFKLDTSGVKLKLAEWSRMTLPERRQFAVADCNTAQQVTQYREDLCKLILDLTGNLATIIVIEENPAWSRTDEIPNSIKEKLSEFHSSISLQQWKQLNNLQRFVLVKLSYPGHENRNFPKAIKEFGLIGLEENSDI